MNAPITPMPDVQGSVDVRNLPIDRVGVRGLRYPIRLAVSQADPNQGSVGEFSLSVALPAHQKGTHMSRFVALLEVMHEAGDVLEPSRMAQLGSDMVRLLEASAGSIEFHAPVFVKKHAPVSGLASLMDYELSMVVDCEPSAAPAVSLEVKVPVKSLCPCSKEISDYGAHNQRSQVRVRARLASDSSLTVLELIRAVETQASCELWGMLKRPDEKYVTERAYDNAKFVEDLVRDVALSVKALPGVVSAEIEAENFESIHNHSAWARLSV